MSKELSPGQQNSCQGKKMHDTRRQRFSNATGDDQDLPLEAGAKKPYMLSLCPNLIMPYSIFGVCAHKVSSDHELRYAGVCVP